MDKAAIFLKNVKKGDNVVVIFNNDADGMCSCALVGILLREKLNSDPLLISQPMPMDKNLIGRIRTTVPDKIIFLDLAADQQEDLLKKTSGLASVLIIDHHRIHKDTNSSGIVHYNPRMKKKGVYLSTSYLAYKICSHLQDMSDYMWIAAVGMIGDYNLDDSQDLVKDIMKKYGVEKDLYKSFLGRITDMISATQATKSMNCEQLVGILENSTTDDIKKNEKLLAEYRKVENEIMSIMDDAETSAERHGNIILYNFKSNISLRSEISTKLSSKFKGKTVIVYEKMGSKMKLSGRNQSGGNVAKLLEDAANGLDALAGGHEAAAGAAVAVKDWDEFRHRLIELGK